MLNNKGKKIAKTLESAAAKLRVNLDLEEHEAVIIHTRYGSTITGGAREIVEVYEKTEEHTREAIEEKILPTVKKRTLIDVVNEANDKLSTKDKEKLVELLGGLGFENATVAEDGKVCVCGEC